ncbi:hypothetical protein D3C75_985050 [compost metagenome]
MLFFHICKDPFNGLFAFGIYDLVLLCMPEMVDLLQVVRPYMPTDSFHVVFALCTLLEIRAVLAQLWVGSIHPVPVFIRNLIR